MHKTQKSQTYFFHKFILLKDFFKKKRNPLFWVRLALFLLGAYVKSLLLFLKCFLTRQFYEFSFLRCSFWSWHAHFFKFMPRFLYFSISYLHCTSCTRVVRYNTIIYEDVIFISLVAFCFTPYHTTKHNNNNGMRHETIWVDWTIDLMIFLLDRLEQ